MIYTITLNPALDHFLDVEDLRIDDANRVASECLYAGGKGIDVSRAIRRLGSDSMALGFIGAPEIQPSRRLSAPMPEEKHWWITPASPPPPARRRRWRRAINSAGCATCSDCGRSCGSNISGHMERIEA